MINKKEKNRSRILDSARTTAERVDTEVVDETGLIVLTEDAVGVRGGGCMAGMNAVSESAVAESSIEKAIRRKAWSRFSSAERRHDPEVSRDLARVTKRKKTSANLQPWGLGLCGFDCGLW